MTSLRARSIAEEQVYIQLHPCPSCGETLYDHRRELTATGSRYEGKCRRCGTPRGYEFEMTNDDVSDGDPGRYFGGPVPSEIVSAPEWLAQAEKWAKVAPAAPDGMIPAAVEAARKALFKAVAALEEARKLGAPDDLRLHAYDKHLAQFGGGGGGAGGGGGGPRFGAGDLAPLAERVAAARARTPRPRPATASIDFRPGSYVDHLSRAAAAAHAAWLSRGRSGAGRLALSHAKLTGAPAGGSAIPAARFDSCKLTQINLSMSRLSELELIDCLCDEASFSQSELDGALIERSVLVSADLRLTRLRRAKIVLCDGSLARLDRAALDGAHVEDTSFEGAILGDATLDRALFVDCDFRGADLARREPRLRLCSTTDAWFIRCDFRGARFEGRRLSGTTFDHCLFDGAQGKPAIEGKIDVIAPDVWFP